MNIRQRRGKHERAPKEMRVPIAIFWWGMAGMIARPAFDFLGGVVAALAFLTSPRQRDTIHGKRP